MYFNQRLCFHNMNSFYFSYPFRFKKLHLQLLQTYKLIQIYKKMSNFIGVGSDYQQNPFDIFLLRTKQGQYGQQISATSDGLGLKHQTRVQWLKADEYEQGQQNVKRFISSNLNTNNNLRLFRQILKDKIQTGKQYVQNYTLNDIGYYLPYIFSSRYLFQPVRTLLYCLRNKIDVELIKQLTDFTDSQMISNQAVKAVYDSYKYNKTYVTQALEIFSKKPVGIGKKAKQFLGTVFQTVKKSAEAVASIKDQILQAPQKLKSFFGNMFATKQTLSKQQSTQQVQKWVKAMTEVDQQGYRNNIHDFYKLIFHDIRPYGDLLIHFGFLKTTCPRKTINGRLFYYLYEQPGILISSIESKCQVYQSINGVISIIPQSMFTMNFLKGIIKGEVTLKGANLLKQLKLQNTETNQQKQAKQSFRNQYLVWTKRAIAKDKLSRALRSSMLQQKRSKAIKVQQQSAKNTGDG